MKVLVLISCSLLFVSSCRTANTSSTTEGKEDLSATLVQATIGSLDTTSSSRVKLKDRGRRRVVTWNNGLDLLHASSLIIYYDSDQRASSWNIKLESNKPLKEYAGASSVQNLGAWNGWKVSRLKGGLLEGTLVTQKGKLLEFYSNAYAVRYAGDLMRWAAQK